MVNQIKVDGLTSEDEDVSIIQGMIDLIYESDGQFYFVDYKTDAFNRRKGMSDEEIGISSKKISDTNDVLSKYFRNHT